jgi:hypothetical protein
VLINLRPPSGSEPVFGISGGRLYGMRMLCL